MMKITRTLVLVCLALLLVPAATAAAAYPLSPAAPQVQNALGYLQAMQLGDGSIGDDSVTAWVVMGIAATGQDPNNWAARGSGATPLDYLERVTPRLQSATDWERQLLAVTAAGRDPTVFGGVDLVAKVRGFFDGSQFGDPALLNDDVFAILALRSAGAPVEDPQIQAAGNYVASHQNADGGWSYQVGGVSDVDDTAAALMALARVTVAPTGTTPIASGTSDSLTTNFEANVLPSTLTYLHAQQLPDGGFPSVIHGGTVSNTASNSWTITALRLVGEDPNGPSWTTPSGYTPVDSLLELQRLDGSFDWDGVQRVGPIWMTAYALPALMGHAYPVNV